jgi:hypothetical protein
MPIATCPKCAYVRQETDRHIHEGVCPACGIAYQKYIARQQTQPAVPAPQVQFEAVVPLRARVAAHLFVLPQPVEPAQFWGRVAAFLAFGAWGMSFIAGGVDAVGIGNSFMHRINLPFHEFGHVLFMPFGRFLHILGGSLFQVLMPLGLLGVFLLRQRDPFAASLMLWWSGQSLIDLAPYIGDAQYRILPLVGGGGDESHDWGNLLTMMHLIPRTQAIARADFALGALVMVCALLWAALVLRAQWRHLQQA